MPFITSPSILQTKDAADNIVVAVNRALRFQGANVTQDGPAQTLIDVTAVLAGAWQTVGNSLTGPTPDAPVELLGSINDYDVVMKRNGSEILRLISDGLLVKTKNILDLTVDPTVGLGVPAEIGSIGMWDDAGVGRVFIKTGAADTAWAEIDHDAADWSLYTNALTGVSPSLPDQSFGSSNDFDLILKRNAIEYQRLDTNGVNFGSNSFQFDFANYSTLFGWQNGGTIVAASFPVPSSFGALANGYSEGLIDSSGRGSHAQGATVSNTAAIVASGDGSIATGLADASLIQASGSGSFAHGLAENGGNIIVSQDGSTAFGAALANTTNIIVSATGSLAFGLTATSGGDISVSESGSMAFGYLNNDSSITVSGRGSLGGGWTDDDPITVSENGSIAFGDNITSSSRHSQTFGLGHDNSSYLLAKFGRYSDSTAGTPTAWVSTEPLFVLGNGTSGIARNNAYQVDKDGKQTTTASHVNKAIRIVVGVDSVSARTDRTIVFDTTAAGGNLQLPAGENGLEFIFSPKGAGAATYTLLANGGDTFDVAVNTTLSAAQVQGIQYYSGTWYSITN